MRYRYFTVGLIATIALKLHNSRGDPVKNTTREPLGHSDEVEPILV